MKKILILVGIGLVALIGIIAWSNNSQSQANKEKLARLIPNAKATVVASSTCGCCKLYGQYLKQQGFDVDFDFKSQEGINSFKKDNGIPENLQSCHTTRIGDYLVEGHIPVEAIFKLMEEKPGIKGIALPGMPSASPGMPGPKFGPFDIKSMMSDGTDGGTFMQL